MKVNILKLKHQLFTIVSKPYHQIQTEFVIFVSKSPIFAILSLNLLNPKIEKLDLYLLERQIQPLFGEYGIETNVGNWFLAPRVFISENDGSE